MNSVGLCKNEGELWKWWCGVVVILCGGVFLCVEMLKLIYIILMVEC